MTEGGSRAVGLGWLLGSLLGCSVCLKDENDFERKEERRSEMEKVD